LRDRLGVIANAADTQNRAERADPRQRVYFVPGFAGLGAPHWASEARGTITGLTAECGVAELARATLESVGYQTRDLIAAMAADSGLAIDTLRVDGGMAASDWTMQFLADILPARLERPASIETTAWGAAYVAGLQRGVCPGPKEMMARWQAARSFAPAMSASERETRVVGWRKAVAATLLASGA
jgi:glycerol kinase